MLGNNVISISSPAGVGRASVSTVKITFIEMTVISSIFSCSFYKTSFIIRALMTPHTKRRYRPSLYWQLYQSPREAAS